MAIYQEFVTRQMADKITGAPITGGDFQLRDVYGIDLDISMTECTDPLYPGRYTSGLEARAGIWAVQRRTTGAYEDTGEFITVGPGRTPAGLIGSEEDYSCADIVLTDCVHAAAFVPIDAATPTLAHLQAAVDYAAINGIKKVYVGLYKGSPDWAGDGTLSLDGIDGVILDLGGARIKCNVPGIPVVSMAGGVIANGTIEGSGTNAVPEILSNTAHPLVMVDIYFPRSPDHDPLKSATINSPLGTGAKAHYFRCSGHILQKEGGHSRYSAGAGIPQSYPVRNQTSDTACSECFDENSFFAHDPVVLANSGGKEIGDFFVGLVEIDSTAAPSDTVAPFDDSANAAKAVKNLWFVQNPKVNAMWTGSVIADRQIFSGAGKAVMTPMAIFALHEAMGSENVTTDVFYHKDGEGITDSEKTADGSFTLDSGIIVDKIYRGGDTKYEKIVMSLYAYFDPSTIPLITYGDVNYDIMIGWIPRLFNIQTAAMTDLFRDKDGTSFLFPTNVIDVKAAVTQQSPVAGILTETATFCGNAALFGSWINIEMGPLGVPLHDISPPQLRRLSGQALSVPYGSSNFIGVKLDLSFNNRARTDLPRFF